MMPPYIIAEAAQGYEGNADVARLLVRAAKAGGADAVKFQMVWADDLCEIGYQYRDLFQALEMSEAAWQSVADECRRCQIDLVVDVFGPQAVAVARKIQVDGYKLHSTTFFDDALAIEVLAQGKPVYLSVGGIDAAEITGFLQRHDLNGHKSVIILYGYQAEPTPIEGNNLSRMAALRDVTGLEVGFMDHSDGGGEDWLTLSVLAFGLGARVFEKHITLDRALEMEDSVSALGASAFRIYSDALRRLGDALGSGSLDLSEAERGYRGRALKRVVASKDLAAGQILAIEDLRLNRPGESRGAFKVSEVVGRPLKHDVPVGQPIAEEDVE